MSRRQRRGLVTIAALLVVPMAISFASDLVTRRGPTRKLAQSRKRAAARPTHQVLRVHVEHTSLRSYYAVVADISRDGPGCMRLYDRGVWRRWELSLSERQVDKLFVGLEKASLELEQFPGQFDNPAREGWIGMARVSTPERTYEWRFNEIPHAGLREVVLAMSDLRYSLIDGEVLPVERSEVALVDFVPLPGPPGAVERCRSSESGS